VEQDARKSQRRPVVLLIVLGAAVLGLLARQTGLVSFGSGTGGQAQAMWCIPPHLPPPATVDASELGALRGDLLRALAPLRRSRYSFGTIDASNLWSDNSPESLRNSRTIAGRWPETYEMRMWTRDREDLVGDVLEFATASAARRVFDEATATGCRRAARERSAPWSEDARNLAWINPDNAIEEDVLLLRGRRVYRIADVLPGAAKTLPSRRNTEPGVVLVDVVACALPEARCAGIPQPHTSRARAHDI
jgi:hypothetical protein